MRNEVTIFCPATVSNVGPGFDLLGFALETPGDELVVKRNDLGKLQLIDQSGTGLPLDPHTNVAAIAASALLDELKIADGFDLIFTKKINPGSGLGSSAASCVAAVMGINELLGAPLSAPELLPYAMEGEQAASGSYHADNIAPALLGGFTLIRGYDPLDIKHIPYPDDLHCAVVHPDLQFKTSEGRKVIPKTFPIATAIAQAGNLAGLIAGLTTSDHGLIGRSIVDHFAEPYRTGKLPEFEALRKKTTDAGALGSGLSGSGPSIFALCRSREIAESVAAVMQAHFSEHDITSNTYVSKVSEAGCRITG
ncbi:MAG: homoserine kinase [Bacteroidales bacterium]|nr:homoserine kinase [Bacteroidales bacterium]MDT8432066.1 homoserine kinase [Bacteroidales bacterium]